LGRHLSDELVMFPQSGLQFHKNGIRFGFLGCCNLGAKLSNPFVQRGNLHNYKAQAFRGGKTIGTPVYSGEGIPVAQ
jgi:hypothetical protein